MPDNENTTKFKVDITELKKSMQEAQQSAKLADSEFKKVASTCDDWSKSSDGISAKITSLNSAVDAQKQKLKLLEAQYAEVVAEQGASSKAAQDLEIKINEQQATINKTGQEIGKYKARLVEVSKAEKIAAKTGQNVSDVLDDMAKKANDAEGGFTVLKGALANLAGNAMSSLAGAVKDGISNIIGLADETREYRTELAKMQTTAQQAGASTDYIKDKWLDMSSVLGDEGAVSEGLNNLVTAGFTTQDQLDAITGHLEGAAIKWKDTLKFEGLADGLQETLATGKAVGPFSEMLERSGVNLETFDKGLEKCKTSAEKQNYTLQQLSKLGLNEVSSAYRDQNADLIAANKANGEYTDNMATMGAKIEPLITTVKQGFNDLLGSALELVEDVDMEQFSAKVEEGFAVLKDDILPAVRDGFQWVLDNWGLISAGFKGIATGIAAYTAYTTAVNIMKNGFMSLEIAQKAAAVGQAALNAAMSINPIGALVAAIAGLVAAFVVLWNKCEPFKQFCLDLWDGIKNAVGDAGEWIKNAFNKVVEFFTVTIPEKFKTVINWVKENFDLLLTFLINPFAGLFKYFYENNTKFKEFVDNAIKYIKELPGKIWTWFLKAIDKTKNFVTNMATKAKEAGSKFLNNVINYVKNMPGNIANNLKTVISNIISWAKDLGAKAKEAGLKLFNGVVDNIKELPTKILSVGKDLVAGLWNGITDKFSWLTKKIKGFASDVTNKLKDFFGVHSPSVIWAKIGEWLSRGLAVGIDAGAKWITDTIKKVGENMLKSEQYYLDESNRLEAEKEEAAYQEKLKAAKTAEEIEKVKQERINAEAEKQQQTYLDNLKAAADKERKLYDEKVQALEDMLNSSFDKVKEVGDLQKSLADALFGAGDMTYKMTGFAIGNKTEKFAVLADVSADNATLEKYNTMLDELHEKRGVLPAQVASYLQNMGVTEGISYVEAMLNASDDAYAKYIADLEEKSRLAESISKKVTTTQIVDLTAELTEQFGTIPEEFLSVGSNSAVEFGEAFINGIGEVLIAAKGLLSSAMDNLLDVNISSLKSDVFADVKSKIAGVKASISGASASLTNASGNASTLSGTAKHGPVATNFTQNIYSPKALNRVAIYRQTKNLFMFAGGGN